MDFWRHEGSKQASAQATEWESRLVVKTDNIVLRSLLYLNISS
jgi:hypothetical protein